MFENYDDYCKKKKDDYFKSLPQKDTDELELPCILEYHSELCYDSMRRISQHRQKLAKKL